MGTQFYIKWPIPGGRPWGWTVVFLIHRFRAKWIAKIVIFGTFDLTMGKGPFFNGVADK